MRHFTCDGCAATIYFEDSRCLSCDRLLGFLPDEQRLSALEPLAGRRWRPLASAPSERTSGERAYRLCANALDHQVCNWLVTDEQGGDLCRSCRLNQTVPDLTVVGNDRRWRRLERAKRRLLYSLYRLGLPVVGRDCDSETGLAFDFIAATDAQPVNTGHNNGLITVDIAEADDDWRERTRIEMNEAYRTLLGHLRHESGHYYWPRLVFDADATLAQFRALFGDERQDYGQALQRHYQQGPMPDWHGYFISAYASAHPWEDWAETWAHYLHMIDTVETARASGIRLPEAPLGAVATETPSASLAENDFSLLIESWRPLTIAVNNLNRSMGLRDFYPFALTDTVTDKLRFIHRTIYRATVGRADGHK